MLKSKRNLVNMGLLNIVGVILMFLIARFALKGIRIETQTLGGIWLLILIAACAATIWISYVYLLDRKEREPLQMVATAFAAGILGYAVFSGFLGGRLFTAGLWSINAPEMQWFHLVFTRGILPATCIWFLLRIFFFPNPHFNEPVDGMVYGAFIGVGYGLATSMNTVFSLPFISAYNLVLSLLLSIPLHSSLGALAGYYFGIARFDSARLQRYLLLSLAVCISLYSTYAVVDELINTTVWHDPDPLALTAMLAAISVVLTASYMLIQTTLDRPQTALHEGIPFGIGKVSLITLVVLLTVGTAGRAYVERDTRFAASNGAVTFMLPAAYALIEETPQSYTFAKNIQESEMPVSLNITVVDESTALDLGVFPAYASRTVGDYTVTVEEFNRFAQTEIPEPTRYSVEVVQCIAVSSRRKVRLTLESPIPVLAEIPTVFTTILDTIREGS